jgi:hypothetical protein
LFRVESKGPNWLLSGRQHTLLHFLGLDMLTLHCLFILSINSIGDFFNNVNCFRIHNAADHLKFSQTS